jgi:hypothetical protein
VAEHETTYKGSDGTWTEWECEECGFHMLLCPDDLVYLDRGDETALHHGSSTADLIISAVKVEPDA